MTEFYYTVTRNEIRQYMSAVPVLVSAAGWTVLRAGTKIRYRLRQPPLPAHVVERAADCGGFVATTRWGGQYRFTPNQYVTWLMKWQPQWAATMDLCCFDLNEGVPVYPGKEEVERRQRFTTEMAGHFWATYQHLPLAWAVTLQGWYPEDYVRHAQVLAPLIREMAETYFNVGSTDEDGARIYYRVGIGSLCGRDPLLVQEIVAAVRAIIGHVPLHLWGTKIDFLRCPIDAGGNALSLDSAAWNNLWGPTHEARRRSGLSEARYCWDVSYPRYALSIAKALRQPKFASAIDLSTVPQAVLKEARTLQRALPLSLCYQKSGLGPNEYDGTFPE